MDQRSRAVEEDVKNILHTRLALSDKMQLMEDEIQRILQSIKIMVRKAVDDAANVSVQTIKSTVDHARRRRWILLGGATVIGLLAAWQRRPKNLLSRST